jgi:hypothetical protein
LFFAKNLYLNALTAPAMASPDNNHSCYYNYGDRRCYNSGWYNWGRWVLLGLIVLFFFLTLLCLSR